MTALPQSIRTAGAALLLAGAAALPARAQAPTEPPLRWTHTDTGLTWAPCPPIFPAGCEVAVLHGNPGTGPSDVFLRAPAGYVFPPHWHTSAEHMVVVAGLVQVTYTGGLRVEVPERAYALVPAKTGHRAACRSAGPCVMFIRFDGPIDAGPSTDVP